MQVCFVSYPFSRDRETNEGLVVRIARRLALEGYLPIAPQIYLPRFVREDSERELGLGLCLRLVSLADDLRVYGSPTEGMLREIAEARRMGLPVVQGELP